MRNDVLVPSRRRSRRETRISISWCLGIAVGLLLPIIAQSQSTTACFAELAVADGDNSASLSQTEYFQFVDSSADSAINATTFSNLPEPIQWIFILTACPTCRLGNSTCFCSKSVPIYGARPSDQASARTVAKLVKFCRTVQNAISAATATTTTNTTSSPSAKPLNTTADLTAAPAPAPSATAPVASTTAPVPVPSTTAPVPTTTAPAPSPSFGFVLPTAPATFPSVELPTTGFLTLSPTLKPQQLSTPTISTSNPSVARSNTTTFSPTTQSAAPTTAPSPVAIGADTLVPSLLQVNITKPPSVQVDGGTIVPSSTEIPTASDAPTLQVGQTLEPSVATEMPTLFVINDTTLSPNSSPTPVASDSTPAPTMSSQQCTIALAYSDIGRDSTLDTDEYIRFLGRFNYEATSFSSLPQVLQSNFFKLAGSGSTIDISGTLPGTTPTSDQSANLENICLQTSLAISQARSGVTSSPMASSGSPATTSQPSSTPPVAATSVPSSGSTPAPAAPSSAPAGSTGPTISISQCFTAMAFADLNRDDYLNQEEYVRFLNKITGDAYASASFSTLPTSLVSNFNTLASSANSEIYVYGARPGESADSTQATFLSQVCTDTQQALAQGTSPSTAPIASSAPAASPTSPTSSPVASVPSVSPTKATSSIAPTALSNGPVPVISAFAISNTAKLAAADLSSGLNRQGLEKAYRLLVNEVLYNLSTSVLRRNLKVWTRHSRRQRRRQLKVSFQNNSATIDRIKDTTCPSGAAAGSQCQNVIAHYVIVVADMENVSAVQQDYVNATQAAIEAGHLGSALKKADPQSAISVTGAIPIPVDALAPTSAPSSAPVGGGGGGGSEGASSGGSNMGAIIGGVVAGLLGLFVIGWYARRRSRAPPHPSKDDKFASAPKFDDIVNAQKQADSSENDQDFPDLEDSPVPGKDSPEPKMGSPTQEQPPDRSNPSMFGGLFRKRSDMTSNKNLDAGDNEDGSGVVSGAPSSPPDSRRSGFGLFGGQRSLRKKTDGEDDGFGENKKEVEEDEMEEPSETDEVETSKKGGFNVFGMGAKKRHSDPGVFENSQSAGAFGEQSVDFSEYSFDEPTVMQEQQQMAQRHSAPPTFKDATSSSGWSTGDESPSSQDSFFESAEWAGAHSQVSPAAPSQSGVKTPKAGSKAFPNGQGDDDDDEDEEDEEDEDEEEEEEESEEEESESYTDGDSTYQSNGMKDEATFDGTMHSDYDRQLQDALQREERAKAKAGEQLSDDLRRKSTEMDRMVDMEDWEGVAAAASHFPSSHQRFSDDEESEEEEEDDDDDEGEFENDNEHFDEDEDDDEEEEEEEEDEDDEEEEEEEDDEEEEEESNVVGGSNYEHSEGSGDESYVSEEGSGVEDSASGADPHDAQRRAEYRAEVEALVRMVVPDEIDNVDVMMAQFRGREAELVATLRTMQERSVTQRARAAVHRTKGGGSGGSSFSSSPASASATNRSRSTAASSSKNNRRTHGAFDEESEDTPNGW